MESFKERGTNQSERLANIRKASRLADEEKNPCLHVGSNLGVNFCRPTVLGDGTGSGGGFGLSVRLIFLLLFHAICKNISNKLWQPLYYE